MSDFTVEISVEDDKKVITLDADEMDICIYQETGNGMVRVFEITCDAPGDKVIGTISTKVEFVGADDDPGALIELKTVKTYLGTSIMEAYNNKHGG
jgi:hypothetical protein